MTLHPRFVTKLPTTTPATSQRSEGLMPGRWN